MGCVKFIGAGKKVVCSKHSWDQFRALFKVKDLVEVEKTEVSYFTSNKPILKNQEKGGGNESKKDWE